MLRIDQIPSDDYITIMVAVESAALSAERDAGSTALLAEQFAQLAKGIRAAKALLEAHRYPKFAELAAVPA